MVIKRAREKIEIKNKLKSKKFFLIEGLNWKEK